MFFEVRGLADGFVSDRFDELARFVRREGLAEKLVNGVQIHWQRENSLVDRGFEPVYERTEPRETIDIVPDILTIGVENMWTILVHHDLCCRVAFRVNMPTDMTFRFENGDATINSFRQLSREDRTGQAGTSNDIMSFQRGNR